MFFSKDLTRRKEGNETKVRTPLEVLVEGFHTINTSSNDQIFSDSRLREEAETEQGLEGKARLGHAPWRICPQVSNCLMYKTKSLRLG